MKKKLLVLFVSLLMLLSLVACGEKTIVNTFINGDMHLIVDYSDNTSEDLGYVGVEKTVTEKITITDKTVNDDGHLIVTYSNGETEDLGDVTVVPPQYTVRFLDKNGNILKTETVYKGTSASAPDAPAVTDMVFKGWDAEFTSVQKDMDIHPVYIAMEAFTVTFKDEQGNTLKTESVITGRSATAPTAPTRTDTVFDKWDKDFTNVTSDMVVTAVYRAKDNVTVTFKDYTGVTLGTASVKEGGNVTAPVTPTRDGYKFNGWSSSLNNITSNKTVTAQYKFNGGTNVLDLSYALSGNTLTVTVTMKGSVKFAALEGEMTTPSGLTFKSVSAGDDKSLANRDGNTIYFSTTNTTNITSETVVFKATFTVGNDASYTLNTTIKDICDQDFNSVSSSVVGKTVKVK